MAINFQTNREEGLDLRNTDLTTANLRGAFLVGAHLEGANLDEAHLEGAHLERAHLEGAHLEGAYLEGAHLMGTDLSGAHLSGIYLWDADLTGAHLEGAILQYSNIEGAIFKGAHLERADLIGSNVIAYGEDDIPIPTRGVHLEGAYLMGADLGGLDLRGVNLIGTDLTGADLRGTDFRGADLTGTRLRGADLRGTRLRGADLEGAHLEGADFRGAHLEGAIGVPTGYVMVPPPTGVAYEVHNAFATFQSKQNEYLTIIVQSDFKGVVAKFPQFVNKKFKQNITEVFPGDDNKLTQFNNVFKKSKDSLRSLDPETLQLIYKSITFAFSQDKAFKVQYITTFLDETCNAYAGPYDNTSCVKGILERFVLSVGNAVQILCIAGCDNETYKELDILMNSKFIIEDAASSWWEWLGDDQSVNWKAIDALAPEKRKENFIAYLKAEAIRLGSDNKETNAEIVNYADNKIGYSFAKLQLGGRKSKKSKKTRKSKKSKKTKKTKKSKKSRKIKKSMKSKKFSRITK